MGVKGEIVAFLASELGIPHGEAKILFLKILKRLGDVNIAYAYAAYQDTPFAECDYWDVITFLESTG